MSLISTFRLLQSSKSLIVTAQYATKSYAGTGTSPALKGKKIKKPAAVTEKVQLPVQKDINKLLTYACGTNIYKEGEDVKLKPDSEYPDWLWNLKTEVVPLEELDPDTKAYWKRVRKEGLRRNNRKAASR